MALSTAGSREINVTPLIDVLLVLLVIFLIIMPIMLKSLTVELPPKSDALEPQATVGLKLEADLSVSIDDGPRFPSRELPTRLRALLGKAGERAPYVMVGHSWGGEIVRLYAMQYPAEIVGLVLIDSSHEEQVKRFAAIAPAAPPGNGGRLGVTPPSAPPPEQADLVTMGAELSKKPWHANIPLVVLTRTPPADPQADPRGQVWQELQRELATRSPQGEQIVAQKSGHYVQNDEPTLVIDAVRRVLRRLS